MRIGLKYIFIILLLTGTVPAQIRISAQVENKDIYVGENFGYYIVIEGAQQPGQVDLKPLQKYQRAPMIDGSRSKAGTGRSNGWVLRLTACWTAFRVY